MGAFFSALLVSRGPVVTTGLGLGMGLTSLAGAAATAWPDSGIESSMTLLKQAFGRSSPSSPRTRRGLLD